MSATANPAKPYACIVSFESQLHTPGNQLTIKLIKPRFTAGNGPQCCCNTPRHDRAKLPVHNICTGSEPSAPAISFWIGVWNAQICFLSGLSGYEISFFVRRLIKTAETFRFTTRRLSIIIVSIKLSALLLSQHLESNCFKSTHRLYCE